MQKQDSFVQVNAADILQRTPLQIACSQGNIVGVKALCKHGAEATEKALMEAVGARDGHDRASIVQYLLDDAGLENSLHGSQASTIASQAVSKGPSDAAALIIERQKAKGTTVNVPDSDWLAAAEHVTDDDPLLDCFPLNIPATAAALGRAWSSRKQQSSSGSRYTRGTFSDDGTEERQYLQLPRTSPSDLLKRVCKGARLHRFLYRTGNLLHKYSFSY